MQTADCGLGIKCRPAGLKKKVPSGHLGQVDFPSGQVAFHSHLPMGKGSDKLFVQTCIVISSLVQTSVKLL